jgi:hypothetical protein
MVLAGLGVVLLIASGLADVIGISFNEGADGEFGWKQIAGLAVGLLIAVAGLVIALSARKRVSGEP